ncbi:hypothetical protein CRENBAI_023245, partial [Crenichthys baileyi]
KQPLSKRISPSAWKRRPGPHCKSSWVHVQVARATPQHRGHSRSRTCLCRTVQPGQLKAVPHSYRG